MIRKVALPLSLLLAAGLFLNSCSKSDDQRRFEDRSQAEPAGITEMTADGHAVEDRADPDDWETAPMYSGLIEVETPAWPNPVSFNSNLRIDLYLYGVDNLNRIEVYAFEFPGQLYGISSLDLSSSSSLVTINLNADAIATSSGAGASGIYRLLLYDGRENLITYGDVLVE